MGGDNGCFCSLFFLLLFSNIELCVVVFVGVVTDANDLVFVLLVFDWDFGCVLGLFIWPDIFL